MTKIYLRKSVIDGNTKIEMVGENLPKNFLGMATDLKVLNADGVGLTDFTLEKAELGEAFKAQPEQFQPIFLYKSDQVAGEIVLGLSLKANNLAEVKDGVLLNLYLKNNVNLTFEKPILSIYEGGRRDLIDTVWENSVQISQGTSQVAAIKQDLKVSEEEIESASQPIEEILTALEEKSPLNWAWQKDGIGKQADYQVWWFVGFVLLIVAIVGLIIFRERWIKLIKWPKKLISAQEKG